MIFVLLRYFNAGLSFARALILAKILGVEIYGTVIFTVQLVLFLSLITLGGASGFIWRYYSDYDELLVSEFPLLNFLWFSFFGTVFLVVSLFFSDHLMWTCIIFLISAPSISVEPVLRVNNMFNLTVVPEVILNVIVTVMFLFAYFFSLITLNSAFLIFVAGYLTAHLSYIIWLQKKQKFFQPLTRQVIKSVPRKYFRLIKKGFPLFIATAMYVVFSFLDRIFISRFHTPEDLSVYSLAFQLVLAVSLGLQALNYVHGVKIGEALKKGRALHRTLRRALQNNLLFSMISFIGILGITWTLSNSLYKEFSNLLIVVAVMGVGMVAYHVQGAVSPYIFYIEKRRLVNTCLVLMVATELMVNVVVALQGKSYMYLVMSSSILYFLYSLISFAVVFYNLRKNKMIGKEKVIFDLN
jgi:O-antigen/teichoic acid export membrane protein